MTVFIDTSAFFAVLDADDQMHSRARREWERLLETDTTLRTTNYVLVETSALLQSRIGMDGLRVFAADVVPALDVTWVDAGMHLSAHHSLLVASRRDLSLVDCVSFEAMRRLRIENVFCFDSHFAEQGFQPHPDA
jgi:predicted nucleic acid-binding protein